MRRRGLDRGIGDELAEACLAAIEANLVIVDEGISAALEVEARARSLRDPADWPVVASALVLTARIWTNDNDFLGTGVATWTTDTTPCSDGSSGSPSPDPRARPQSDS